MSDSLESRLAALVAEFTSFKEVCRDNFASSKAGYSITQDRLAALESKQAADDIRYDHILAEIREIKVAQKDTVKEISELTGKGGKRWEQVITTAMSCGITALVTWLITNMIK